MGFWDFVKKVADPFDIFGLDPKQEEYREPRGLELQSNTRTTNAILPVVYGHRNVGGNDVYIKSTGKSNNILWIVQTLSEGVCSQIYSESGVEQVWVDDKLYNEYGGNVSYYFHDGSSTQTVDTNLNTADNNWTDPLRNTCYLVWKLTYNKNYFQRIPKRQVELKGIEVYDFRDASTSWSDNAVLCLYDYMTNARYGLGISSSKFDTGAGGSWRTAADYYDSKGWSFNYAINEKQAADTTIQEILKHFRGTLNWWNNKFYLRYADLIDDTYAESYKMSILDKHIQQDDNGLVSLTISEPSRWKNPDSIRVKFPDAEKDWADDELIIGDASGQMIDIELAGCTSRQHAADFGVYYLERAQLNRRISGTFMDQCLKLEPHDPVKLTCTAFGLSQQPMRVESTALNPNGTVDMTMMYESEDLYNQTYDLDTESVYQCILPDPTAPPTSVINIEEGETVYNYRERSFTRWDITFTIPDDFQWSHAEVWRSFDPTSGAGLYFGDEAVYFGYEFLTFGNVGAVTDNYYFAFIVGQDQGGGSSVGFSIDPVEEGQTYYIKIRSVNRLGVKESFASCPLISRTVVGRTTEEPDSLVRLYATSNDNAINIYADRVDDADVELYEFRLAFGGSGWGGAIFLASKRHPSLSLFGVKPGTHTFFANTFANNGLYGTYPRSAAIEIIDPPGGWQDAAADSTSDYTDGTHDNTHFFDYSGSHYLKCSHGGQAGSSSSSSSSSSSGSLSSSSNSISSSSESSSSESVSSSSASISSESVSSSSASSQSVSSSSSSLSSSSQSESSSSSSWSESMSNSRSWSSSSSSSSQSVSSSSSSSSSQSDSVSSSSLSSSSQSSSSQSESSSSQSASSESASSSSSSSSHQKLYGKWISDEFDKGSNAVRLVWVGADILVTGAGNTWVDIAPAPDTWADMGISKSWVELFDVLAAPTVNFTLAWDDNTQSDWNDYSNYAYNLEILTAVTEGRYYRLMIEITDPLSTVNAIVEQPTINFYVKA